MVQFPTIREAVFFRHLLRPYFPESVRFLRVKTETSFDLNEMRVSGVFTSGGAPAIGHDADAGVRELSSGR